MSGVSGEQLYAEICAAAARAGVGLQKFTRPLWGGADSSWKIEQLRMAKFPQRHTIERVRALVAGEPLPPAPSRKRGVYDHGLQRMSRVDRAEQGLPPSQRQIREDELAAIAVSRAEQVERRRRVAEIAHVQRRPGQTLADCVREIEMAAWS